MPEQPPPPAPEVTSGLVRASTNALALTQRTSAAVGLTQLVQREASAAYWFERGLVATQAARWDEAAHAYRQCVERDAEHWRAGVRMTEALGRLGQAEGAARALIEASEVALAGWQALVAELPEQIWSHLRDCLESARSTAQNGFELLLGLARVYRALKQKDQARRTLDVMQFMYQQQVAESAQWFRLSGLLYSDVNNYAEAIINYSQAIELKPDYFLALFNRGNAQEGLENYKEAIIDYSRGIELQPALALAYHIRGNAKDSLQAYNEAIADYSRAIELKPNYTSSYFNRGSAKYDLKDYVGAIADYDRAIELSPEDEDYYFFRGDARDELGNYSEAIADYDSAIKLKPDYALAYHYRGITKANLQNYVAAVTDYNRAIELVLNNAAFYRNRAISKEKLSDTVGAAADRTRAAELEAQQINK